MHQTKIMENHLYVAMAIAAHPDDIDFMMAGTLLRLREAGWSLHYMNVANGSCGSMTLGPEEIAAVRTEEARHAAEMLGATFHPPLVNDIEIFYTRELLARLGAIIRDVSPTILLLPSPVDYMEDHQNIARLSATAAFLRGVPNWPTDPPRPPVENTMAVYHAMPYHLIGPLREPIRPELYVDVTEVMAQKRDSLACHASQKGWLDESQGLDSYLTTMEEMTRKVGVLSGRFEFAEGWRRHSHMGFGPEEFDPLSETLTYHIHYKNGKEPP